MLNHVANPTLVSCQPVNSVRLRGNGALHRSDVLNLVLVGGGTNSVTNLIPVRRQPLNSVRLMVNKLLNVS